VEKLASCSQHFNKADILRQQVTTLIALNTLYPVTITDFLVDFQKVAGILNLSPAQSYVNFLTELVQAYGLLFASYKPSVLAASIVYIAQTVFSDIGCLKYVLYHSRVSPSLLQKCTNELLRVCKQPLDAIAAARSKYGLDSLKKVLIYA